MCRSRPIVGSATFVIDASITIMNWVSESSRSARFLARGVSSAIIGVRKEGERGFRLLSGTIRSYRSVCQRNCGQRVSLMPEAPPAKIERADKARNRARILEAAAQAFAESGSDTQMDEIAARAGLGVGTLYRHFATK